MKLKKYSLEQLIHAVSISDSIRECLQHLNVCAYGGNYEIFKKAIKHFNIDISHFTCKKNAQKVNLGRSSTSKRDIKDILTYGSNYGSNKLRKRLLSNDILSHQCCNCKLTEWCGVKIPLELDHINGDRNDNQLHNLRLLCPNCHALTPTYRGKNKKQQ